ncbi:hypothetical protein KP509_03G073500 [Ceratopteris richardii]|uniref:DUF659 domain-containing protein n=1 Tax=Ceratopteris richardii TaxID=49495 RepID=A0A8T2V8M5_CERRI|nr:hypothetical protein KP509_03G073500 [Ceratopteris richardii]
MVREKHEAFDLHCVGVEKDTKKSNSHHWTCKYCGKRYTSGATRLLQHISKLGGQVAACKEIPDHIASEIRQKMMGSPSTLPTSVRGYASHSSRATVSTSSHEEESHFHDSNVGSSSQSPLQRESQSMRQSGLGQAPGHVRSSLTWIKEKQKIADIEIARTVIMENLSFNLLNSNQWKTMVKAISEVGPCQGWSGPSYSDMRTTKIDEEKKRIDLSLASCPYAERKNRGIINILVSCPIGTFFLRAVEVGKKGKKTTGVFIYRHIKKAIEEVGSSNVVQVVTDNASNCRHMGQLLEGEYPHIVWTPCATHCLDLLMEDIGKLTWVKACTLQASNIVTFFTQKVKVLAMFREHSKLEIKKPATTRFAYMWIVLSRLLEVKWDESTSEESKSMQRLCLDESFWDGVRAILGVITPIYKALRMTDCEGATLGLLIHIMRRAMQEIRECTLVTEEQRDEVLEVNVDKFWPSVKDTPLPSHDVPQDEEELLFADLYRELCSIDVRQTRGHSRRRVRGVRGRGKGLIIRRASTTSHGDGASTSRAPASTYTRRQRSTLSSLQQLPLSPRFDDEGNLISDPPTPPSSTYEMTSSDSLDENSDDSDIDEMDDE